VTARHAPEQLRDAAQRLDQADDIPDHHREDLDLLIVGVLAQPQETSDA
jgi:hypothetical protein